MVFFLFCFCATQCRKRGVNLIKIISQKRVATNFLPSARQDVLGDDGRTRTHTHTLFQLAYGSGDALYSFLVVPLPPERERRGYSCVE